MLYISESDLLGLTAPAMLTAALEQGLRDFAAGKVRVPPRQHLGFSNNTLLTMPAAGDAAFGVKVVSVVPSNAARNLPVTNGLMMLSDGATGMPLAVINAAMMTAQRTGAIGALALKYMTPPETDSIGLIGAGVQGTWQVIYSQAVRPIKTAFFVASSDARARVFTDTVSRHAPAMRLVRCASANELLDRTSVIVAATTANEPLLTSDERRLTGRHFTAIGAYKPTMQELPDAVYALSRAVVIDSDAAKSEAGDLVGPLTRGVLHERNVIHLADLITGQRRLATESRASAFKSVGMALYDLYAALSFFEHAQRAGVGTLLDF